MTELAKPNIYVNYVRMAGGSVSLVRFLNDWIPIGATVAADLIAEGLLILTDGVLYVPPN
jgi:hypothetical protein